MIYLQIIFWICFAALAHTYVVYPLLLKFLASFASPPAPLPKERGEETAVSILIAAYNEEKVIKEKLESIFNSNYSKKKTEVIVGSDASTDKTNEIIKLFPAVQLVEFKERSGKIRIINHLKSIAKHEILILTDANVMFDKNTIHELTKHFCDPKIALVDSNMQNINQRGGISKAESTYIRGEVGTKNNEGKVFGMMMGPFGGCYAVRKSFYEDVPENFLVDDFYINMKVLEKGGKAISELNAKVYEEVPSDWKIEFKRKIRIATGSFQNYIAFLHLIPKFNTLSFCFLSHKLLRWKGPFLMIGLYISSFVLTIGYLMAIDDEAFYFAETTELLLKIYSAIFLLQNLLVLILFLDLILSALKINSPTRIVTHFFTTNLALLIGFFKFLFGVKSSVWQPTKR
ncbi:MAG: glycosyltransferase [Bacteroidetes bacterium]|nr:glycosyltransferase [Bacteroidota bacterium]